MSTRSTLAATAAAALTPLLVLAGCTPATPATPSPTVVGTGPTAAAPQCTPEAGGTATPCTEQQYAEQKKLDALYTEAENVYRRFVAEDVKLLRSGGLAEGPVLDLIAGPMIERYAQRKKEQHDLSITMTGDVVIGPVHRLPGYSYEGSEATLSTCLDGSGMVGYGPTGKNLGKGIVVVYNTYFKRVDGNLKLWWEKSQRAESC